MYYIANEIAPQIHRRLIGHTLLAEFLYFAIAQWNPDYRSTSELGLAQECESARVRDGHYARDQRHNFQIGSGNNFESIKNCAPTYVFVCTKTTQLRCRVVARDQHTYQIYRISDSDKYSFHPLFHFAFCYYRALSKNYVIAIANEK